MGRSLSIQLEAENENMDISSIPTDGFTTNRPGSGGSLMLTDTDAADDIMGLESSVLVRVNWRRDWPARANGGSIRLTVADLLLAGECREIGAKAVLDRLNELESTVQVD
jgi:hypothetical protein